MIKRVLITAGGTGGHIFPALAVARILRQHNIEVAWLGARNGMENKVVPGENIPLYTISISGLRGKSLFRLLFTPWKLLLALTQSMRIVHKYSPDVVLGMGGFVSGPGGLAAWLLRKRLVIHEQNAIPGMTNRILAKLASTVFTGFPYVCSSPAELFDNSSKIFPNNSDDKLFAYHKKTYLYSGNPVRPEIAAIASPEERYRQHTGTVRLFIFGGSRGALDFNRIIPKAIAMMPAEKRPAVWHQAGERFCVVAQEGYAEANIDARIDSFIADMASAYEWADLVIARAGASTIAELSAVGIASILIPYPYAVDDHQTANAYFLTNTGAAKLLPNKDFTPENLASILSELMSKRDVLLQMAENARALRKVDAAEVVVSTLNV